MTRQRAQAEIGRTSALAGELRVVISQVMRRLRQEAQMQDLSWSQTKALIRLEVGGPATVTQLAQADGVRPQSMGATVASLEAVGLVQAAAHPTDGRQTVWSLTELCRRKAAEARAAREDWLHQKISAELSPTEQDDLARALDLLRRLAEA